MVVFNQNWNGAVSPNAAPPALAAASLAPPTAAPAPPSAPGGPCGLKENVELSPICGTKLGSSSAYKQYKELHISFDN